MLAFHFLKMKRLLVKTIMDDHVLYLLDSKPFLQEFLGKPRYDYLKIHQLLFDIDQIFDMTKEDQTKLYLKLLNINKALEYFPEIFHPVIIVSNSNSNMKFTKYGIALRNRSI